MYGPAKPPVLPMQLIAPIVAAADAPVRKVLGKAQKGGSRALLPMAAIENATTPKATPPFKRVKASPAPAANSGMAVCQWRSRWRSELQPTRSIAGQAAR